MRNLHKKADRVLRGEDFTVAKCQVKIRRAMRARVGAKNQEEAMKASRRLKWLLEVLAAA